MADLLDIVINLEAIIYKLDIIDANTLLSVAPDAISNLQIINNRIVTIAEKLNEIDSHFNNTNTNQISGCSRTESGDEVVASGSNTSKIILECETMRQKYKTLELQLIESEKRNVDLTIQMPVETDSNEGIMLRRENAYLVGLNEEQTNQLNSLEQKISDLMTQRTDIELMYNQLEGADAEITRLNEELLTSRNKLNDVMHSNNLNYNDQQYANKELQQAESTCSQLGMENDQLKNQLQDLRNEYERTKQLFNESTEQANLNLEGSAVYCRTLQERLSLLTKNCNADDTDAPSYAELNERTISQQKELNQLSMNNTEMQRRIEFTDFSFNQQMTDMNNKNITLQSQLNDFMAQSEQSAVQNDILQNLIQTQHENIKTMTSVINDKDDEMEVEREITQSHKHNELETFQQFENEINATSGKQFLFQLANLYELTPDMDDRDDQVSTFLTFNRVLYLIINMGNYFNFTDIQTFLKSRTENTLNPKLNFQPMNVTTLLRDVMSAPPYTQRYNMKNFCYSSAYNFNLYDKGLANNENFMAKNRKSSILVYSTDALKSLDTAKSLNLL